MGESDSTPETLGMMMASIFEAGGSTTDGIRGCIVKFLERHHVTFINDFHVNDIDDWVLIALVRDILASSSTDTKDRARHVVATIEGLDAPSVNRSIEPTTTAPRVTVHTSAAKITTGGIDSIGRRKSKAPTSKNCTCMTTNATVAKKSKILFKTRVAACFPRVNTADTFAAVRIFAKQHGGTERIRLELIAAGFVEGNALTTGLKPFNFIARLVTGKMQQTEHMIHENEAYNADNRFLIAANRPDSDEHWDDSSPEWVGRASMSKRHRFLLLKDLEWSTSNVLTFGLDGGTASLRDAIALVSRMRAAALAFTEKHPDWSENVGLFFHVYGHNSVNGLHLHVLDLNAVGPTYEALRHKNLALDDVLSVLKHELAASLVQEHSNLEHGTIVDPLKLNLANEFGRRRDGVPTLFKDRNKRRGMPIHPALARSVSAPLSTPVPPHSIVRPPHSIVRQMSTRVCVRASYP